MLSRLNHLTQEKWRLALFAFIAGALIASQAFSVVHAAKYGDGPHEHNGAVCLISMVAKGGEKMLGAATFAVALVFGIWVVSTAVPRRVHKPVIIRAARPRGPPARKPRQFGQ